MGNYMEIIKPLFFFIIFVLILLLISSIFLKVFLKNYKFSTEKSKIYGVLFDMSTKSTILLSISTLNFLFLVWCLMLRLNLNFIYLSIIYLTSLLMPILCKKNLKILNNILVTTISVIALYLINYIHIYFLGETSDIFMRICLFFMIAFTFIYFTYNYINDLNFLIMDNKYTAKKKSEV